MVLPKLLFLLSSSSMMACMLATALLFVFSLEYNPDDDDDDDDGDGDDDGNNSNFDVGDLKIMLVMM